VVVAAPSVLVTGIGGNVGQGVLRVLRSLPQPLRLVGTNVVRLSGGNHLCDAVHEVPWAWNDGYVDALVAVCREEEVQLVIPTTDHETVALARERLRLPTVAASPLESCEVFIDKLQTARRFEAAGIPFAASVLPSAYEGQFGACVVKPRCGRGSRGVVIDHPDPASLGDEFLVQERLVGLELTTALYVTRTGELHGHVSMVRELRDGATMACTVTADHDAAVHRIVELMCRTFEIRGSCNVQSVVDDDGRVVPFEVNCRISGTSSIRHHFGFRDVEYTVAEYLDGHEPAPVTRGRGSAVRLLMDVIYPDLEWTDGADIGTPHLLF
jgi:carbamoyl-phosphate synthase large subunit